MIYKGNMFTWVSAVVRPHTLPIDQADTFDICGTAFHLGGGFFMTAAHVVAGDGSFFLATRTGEEKDGGRFVVRAWPVPEIEPFDDIDIAVLRCELPSAVAHPWYLPELDSLTDVMTVGYPFALDLHNRLIRMRPMKGYIVVGDKAAATELKGAPRMYELSFQSPKGLSGAPLFVSARGLAVAGVIIANRSTSLELASDIERVTERNSGTQTETIVQRVEVMHYGVAVQSGSIGTATSKLLGTTVGQFVTRAGQ